MTTKTVATTEASHPRHMLAAVIVSALLSAVVCTAISPSTAQAAQQWNGVNQTALSAFPFDYRREQPSTFVRNKTNSGPMKFNVDYPGFKQGLCVMLLSAADGSRLAVTCWLPYEWGIKTMVTSVGALRFTVWAAQRGNTSNPGEYFGLGTFPDGDAIFY